MSQQTQLPVETLHSTAKPPARLRKLPFYPALAALFALLSVYAFNTDEASPRELLVPAAVVLAATLLLLAIATLALRGMHRAAPPVAAAVFFFLTYGNRVDILWALHPDPRRRTLYHQTVFILQTVLILLITYTAARRLKHPHRLTPRLNELVLFLVTCPLLITAFRTVALGRNSTASEAERYRRGCFACTSARKCKKMTLETSRSGRMAFPCPKRSICLAWAGCLNLESTPDSGIQSCESI